MYYKYTIFGVEYEILLFKYRCNGTLGVFLIPETATSPSSTDIIQLSSCYPNCKLRSPQNIWVSKPHTFDETEVEFVDEEIRIAIFKYKKNTSLLVEAEKVGLIKTTGIYAPTTKIIPEECRLLIPIPPMESLNYQFDALDSYFYNSNKRK